MGIITRLIKHEIEKFVEFITEHRKDFRQKAVQYTPAGDDSVPVKEERLILLKVDGTGKYISAGVLTPSQGAKPGEKIFFGRDQEGNITSKVFMLNDGSYIIDTDTETTGEATGDYKRKTKGVTNILERKDRTYKNEANVWETIGQNRNVTIGGNETKNITFNADWNISGNLKIIVGGSTDIISAGAVFVNGAVINLN